MYGYKIELYTSVQWSSDMIQVPEVPMLDSGPSQPFFFLLRL